MFFYNAKAQLFSNCSQMIYATLIILKILLNISIMIPYKKDLRQVTMVYNYL